MELAPVYNPQQIIRMPMDSEAFVIDNLQQAIDIVQNPA